MCKQKTLPSVFGNSGTVGRRALCFQAILLACLMAIGCRATFDERKVIDLTYSFNEQTVYWPTAERFRLERVAFGYNEEGRWYAANNFSAAEHGGTHIDAPIHFAEGRQTTAEIPIERLIGPARVIDIRDQCTQDRSYRLQVADIERHEQKHGRIARGSIVLVLTGFGSFYPDAKEYLGSDVRGMAEGLRFPGFSAAAARLLVERDVDMIGLDTASLDHGPTTEFPAHRVFADANVPGLENLKDLAKLPPRGATLIALPMKIEHGTGGPCRVIAVLP